MRFIAAGNLPLKYAYTGSAAFTHDVLARSDGYLDVIGPTLLEVEALGCLRPFHELPSAFVEVGPGNGVHTAALLEQLRQRGAAITRYLGLDFSETLLDLCRSRLELTNRHATAIHAGVWDVETVSTPLIGSWRHGDAVVLVGLLGQTLGNVENVSTTLKNVHESIAPGDVLVATVALAQGAGREEQVLAPYRTAAFRNAVLEPFRAAGVETENAALRVGVRGGAVVGEVEFHTSVVVGERRLPAGHVVRCFLSRRFSIEEVPAMFDQALWSLRRLAFGDDGQHAVVIGVRKGEAGEHEPT